MSIRAIQIGLDPDVIDYDSPEFARFPGLNAETLQKAHDANIAELRARGFEVDGCQVDLGETATDTVQAQITATRYDAILIGGGIRMVASNTLLFEALVNLIHAELPDARFVFNKEPKVTPEDIRRWFPDPDAAG